MKMDLDLQGWMFEAEQRWLYETAFRLHDEATIVEIGSWKGLSTSHLCRGCLSSNKKVYAIDTWEGTVSERDTTHAEVKTKDIYRIFLNNMHLLGYSKIVVPLKGESVKVAQNFKLPIDFLFIDGAHDQASVRADIDFWLPCCKENTIIAGHDYIFWEVKKVVDEKFIKVENPVDTIWQSSPKYLKMKN